MEFKMPVTRRRIACLVATGALTLAGAGGLAVSGAGQASAATCTPGTSCTVTGTATLGTGTLSLTTPTSLAWGTTLTGVAQQLVDTSTADTSLTIDDATGTASGWHVTVAATTFTDTTGDTLADATTLVANGSITSETTGTTPDVNCTTTGDCTVPTSITAPVTYPVAVTTAATVPTPVTLYSADAGTGLGSVLLGADATSAGGTAPLAWWVNVPGSTKTGTYTSTFTFNIISGP
jgi:hypothetical protein